MGNFAVDYKDIENNEGNKYSLQQSKINDESKDNNFLKETVTHKETEVRTPGSAVHVGQGYQARKGEIIAFIDKFTQKN